MEGQETGSPAASGTRGLSDDDQELLDRARAASNGPAFTALYDQGDLSSYEGDQSRADLALCAYLAYWTNGDWDATERLFDASALGGREKWTERPDYRERTIERAMDDYAAPDGAVSESAWSKLGVTTVPEFPVDVLPPALREWVEAASETAQTPPDLAAMAVLSVLSAAALGVTIDCGSFLEEVALYLMTVLPSGDRKSTVLKAAKAPLRAIEKERQAEATPRVRETRLRRDVLENRVQKLKKMSAEGSDANKRQAAYEELEAAAQALDSLEAEVVPRLLADDTTPEALANLLATHGHAAILSAESAFIDNVVAGRYNEKGANLHVVCMAYTGEEAFIDRRGADPEHLIRPLLSIGLVVQPHVVAALVDNATARGQGLIGRFAFSVPTTTRGTRRVGTQPIPESISQAWSDAVRRVAEVADRTDTTNSRDGAAESVTDRPPVTLRLSDQASLLVNELQREIEPRLLPGADLDQIADWIGRHHGRIVRIAGLLHLCEHPAAKPISEDTMRAALTIGEYLLAHAQALLAGPDTDVRKATDWLARRGDATVTQRDLHRGPLGSRGAARAAAALADKLVQAGVLRLQAASAPGPTGGQSPSQSYAVHPDLVAANSELVA